MMTIDSTNVFLQYDFVNGSTSGDYLCVEIDEKGHEYLTEVNWKNLTIKQKIEYSYSDKLKFPKIVSFVQKYFNNSSFRFKFEGLRMQMLLLRMKVKKYNKSHGDQIEFQNIMKDTLELTITIPRIPENLSDELKFKSKTYQISYTPRTTFAKVEHFVKKKLGPTGFYVEADDSDSKMIRENIDAKKTIFSWVSSTKRMSLSVNYVDMDLKKYMRFTEEKSFLRGNIIGFERAGNEYTGNSPFKYVDLCRELEQLENKMKSTLLEKYG